MKRTSQKRVTALQFDTALLKEMRHQRLSNAPVNALSSAAMFTVLVMQRLYGKERKASDALLSEIRELMADAKAEREEAARPQEPRRIVLPGEVIGRN